jgi:HK97 family phage prohead protease
MHTKLRRAGVRLLKTTGVGPEGTFEALVAVFRNVDHYSDRILPGAFIGTLGRWAASGDPIPVIFSHQWDDLDAHVGAVLEASETADGLWVRARLDLDEPFAAKMWRLLSERRIREFSFAYDVLQSRPASGGVTELLELELIEVGPCLKGANPATELIGVKTRPARGLAGLSASSIGGWPKPSVLAALLDIEAVS